MIKRILMDALAAQVQMPHVSRRKALAGHELQENTDLSPGQNTTGIRNDNSLSVPASGEGAP